MQKHDAKNASGSSTTQQPSKKVDSDLENQKPMQKRDGDRIKKDDDLSSPQKPTR